jgi:hypothetical protein
LGECDTFTNVTLTPEFQEKVDLWVLDVESFLKESRGQDYVTLFRSETGVSLPLRGLLYARQAKLDLFLRSRIKNLKVMAWTTKPFK